MPMLNKVVIASGNQGKLREFRALLADYACDVIAQSDYDVPEADECGLSFIENAIIKARNASQYTGLPAIADDSGLAVDWLGGAPGIYSARYSEDEHGDGADDSANNKKLLRVLHGVAPENRGARFICALAFLTHQKDPTPVVCVGQWSGRILDAPQGDAGFGYDPLFFVPEFNLSSAGLSPAIKNAHSHRGIAMRQLLALLKSQGSLA